MNSKIDLKVLEETIFDLKNNPEACTTYSGATSIDGNFSILESNPGEQLNKFIQYFYENDFMDKAYLENHKKIENKKIEDMTVQEVLTKLTFLFRGDRFSSGLIYEAVQDGTMLKLVEQLHQLIFKNI